MSSENERAVIGDNNPPEPTAIEQAREVLSDIETEAAAWFDGADIENAAQADDVSRIIDAARQVAKQFDSDRKVEKQPHMDAAKAVDTAWKPLLDGANRIVEVAKGALTPWLIAQERAKREVEEAKRREAEAAAAEARRLAAENDGSLAAAKARDDAIEEAKRKDAAAARAAADKAGAKGAGMMRTVSLRTTWRAAVEDRRALLNYVARTAPADLDEFLDQWAARAVAKGARDLPGVRAWEERAAA